MNDLRHHLVELLDGGHAHIRFDDAVKDFPAELRGKRPDGCPHSAWELLEHLRIAQWDILEFSRDPKHVSPEFPSGYWPSSATLPDDASWTKSIADFRRDLRALADLAPRRVGRPPRENPARRRPNRPPRDHARRRPQRLPPRPIDARPSHARRLALLL